MKGHTLGMKQQEGNSETGLKYNRNIGKTQKGEFENAKVKLKKLRSLNSKSQGKNKECRPLQNYSKIFKANEIANENLRIFKKKIQPKADKTQNEF